MTFEATTRQNALVNHQEYCRRCYRPLPADREWCPGCNPDQAVRRGRRRGVTLVGIAGLPLLVIGMLSLDVRLCMAGAAICILAVLLHVVLSIR